MATSSSVSMFKGLYITSNKMETRFLEPSNFRGIEWFRPPGFSCNENSYGAWKGTYVLNRTLLLLNLGSSEARGWVRCYTGLTADEFDPDCQYCGHDGNLKVHDAISKAPALARFDGTILAPLYTEEGLRDDLEGPEEIVLFTGRVKNAVSLVRVSQ